MATAGNLALAVVAVAARWSLLQGRGPCTPASTSTLPATLRCTDMQILNALLDVAEQQETGRALGKLAGNSDILQQLDIYLLEAANGMSDQGNKDIAAKTMQVTSLAGLWLQGSIWD